MDDQENYDPGPVNTIVDAVRDHGRRGDPDEESMLDRARGSVSGLAMGGEGDDGATTIADVDADFGDESAVGSASGPNVMPVQDDPKDRETTDPDEAAGSFGV